MINYKKIIACALAFCFIGGGQLNNTVKLSDNSIIAFAEYGEKGKYENLVYHKYSKYIEITNFIKEADEFVIPAEIDGLPVTKIGQSAFLECTSLKKITLPDSVEDIGSSAFSGCTNLTDIIIPGELFDIKDFTFSGCTALKSIDLPDSITSIDDRAFFNCESLESIEIPNSVIGIGKESFSGCVSLKEILLPNNVIGIGSYSFSGCTALENVKLGSAFSIVEGTFYGCTNLKDITIPESVNSIGKNAFCGCTNLKSVVIPEKVKKMADSVFEKCKSLESVSLPSQIKSIGDSVFFDCTKLKEITIPENVTSIGSKAFFHCSGLTSITIPEKVESIGNLAFRSCNNLASITIKNTECEIYDTKDTIPETTTVCGYVNSTAQTYAKKYGLNFKNINAIETVLKYEKYDDHIEITGCMEDAVKVDIPAEIDGLPVTAIGNESFQKIKSLESVTLPDGIKNIGKAAFFDCTKLTDITIPDSVENIGNSAFFHCESFKEITIPENVSSIGSYAFKSCNNLASITIKNAECEIYDKENTIPEKTTIYGYAGSTAQAYAEKYGNKFETIEESIIYGDANGDGEVTVTDAVTLQKWLLGKGELSNWKAVDLCKDNKIDVFDFCILKSIIIENMQ